MSVNLSKYQQKASRTLGNNGGYAHLGMGLSGEAGEVCDYLKKVVFHGHPLDKQKLVEELGDVLWYIAALATYSGTTLDEIGEANIDKLQRRYPNGFTRKDSIGRVDVE